MIFLLSGLLLVFPPYGTILAILLVIATLGFNINIWVTNLKLFNGKLFYSNLLTNNTIDLREIVSIVNVNYFALDASNPFAIRRVILLNKSGDSIVLPTMSFHWQIVLDLIHTIRLDYINKD